MSKNNKDQEEFKDSVIRNKFDYELYDEDSDVAEKIIRIKRFTLPDDGEYWKIFENNCVSMTIDGLMLTKNEKKFLRSVEGITWLMQEYKNGIKSIAILKKEIIKKMKNLGS